MPAVATNAADAKNDRVFFGFAAGSIALAFGVLFATIESARQSPSGFVFQTGGGTWLAFAVGAVLGAIVWKIVSSTSVARVGSVMRATLVLLLLGGLATFLYPLRFLKPQTLIDVSHGLVTGVVAVGFLAYMLWRIKRALDRDATENATVPVPPAPAPPVRSGDRP